MITQERVREVLYYDPVTGAWTWRDRPEMSPQWRGRFANKPAGGNDPDTGYPRIRIDGTLYYGHRLAFVYMTGEWPPDEVDHKNLGRSDCKWENLRPATHSQNGLNKLAKAGNRSGYKGATFDKNWGRRGRWVATLQVGKIRYRKGGFESALEAHEQYKRFVEEYCGEHGRAA